MKIGDVEYQGDGNKAIFYYIADKRVDFRQLIKVLAEAFHVRIEMKQIGARQGAEREFGVIGPCGRDIVLRYLDDNFCICIYQCRPLSRYFSESPKVCRTMCQAEMLPKNYEVDAYVESPKTPSNQRNEFQTTDGAFYFFKADILKGTIMYSTDKNFIANAVTITARRAFEIINIKKPTG